MPSTATPKQLSYLKQLATRTGTTFTYPQNKTQASAEIQRLQAITPRGASFAELDVKHGRAFKFGHTLRNAAQVDQSEITGYGSTATWR